jgi:hypothetical protein
MVHQHTPKPVCENEDLSLSRNQELHSVRENRQNMGLIIKKKKKKKYIQLCDKTKRQEKKKKKKKK